MSFTNSDMRHFAAAKEAALTSDYKPHRIGAALTYHGAVIASASNSHKTNPTQKEYNRKYRKFNKSNKPISDSMHAEIACLLSVRQDIDWKRAKLYIYRICPGKKYGHGMARPCNACMSYLRDIGLRRIYYTTDDGYAQERIEA